MVKVRFQSTCPVCSWINSNFYYWVHHNCGGDLYLDNYGYLICEDGDAEDFVFRWKFDCGKYRVHSGGFKYGCLQGFYACLSSLTKLNNPPGNFIMNVMNVLYAHKYEIQENY